jgi:hypothetical protein
MGEIWRQKMAGRDNAMRPKEATNEENTYFLRLGARLSAR